MSAITTLHESLFCIPQHVSSPDRIRCIYSRLLPSYPNLTPELLPDLALPSDSIFKPILALPEIHDSLHSLSLGIQDERTILLISLLPYSLTEGMYLNNLLI